MRTNLVSVSLVAMALLAPAVALADADAVVGRYEVTFEQVTSNCARTGMTFDKGAVVVTKRDRGIAIDIAKVPTLSGNAAKGGRIKASSKVGKTAIDVDGKFSIAGMVDDGGALDAVFVAEFFDGGKPLCTQSWSVAGTRAAEAKPQSAPAMAPARMLSVMPAID
jgi:hypothetical protein